MLYRYKPDEGRNTRQITFWLGEAMIAFACYALRGQLDRFETLRSPMVDAMPSLPVLGATFNGSFVAAVLCFLGGSWAWIAFLARKKTADHLIEVESEMHKVTWPSFKEASNSSIVVIIAVLLLMGFLAFSDWALNLLFRLLLWGGVGQ